MSSLTAQTPSMTGKPLTDDPQAKTVLIVEDDENHAHLLEDYVAELGHSSMHAHNGLEALRLIEKEQPDLVLLDLIMPAMSGLEVLEQINCRTKTDVPSVLVVTGLADEQTLLKCIRHGAADYLMKPVDPHLLRARIEACLEQKALRDRERKYKEDLEASYEALKLAEAARDALSHMIVHDLKGPLGLVKSYLYLMSEHLGSHYPQAHQLQDFTETARRIAVDIGHLIDNILDVSRLEAGQMDANTKRIDGMMLLRTIFEEYKVQANELNISYRLAADEDEACVVADPEMLSRVLQNLVTNAFKHAGRNSAVKLSLERTGKGGIVFSVEDDGPGIPAEDRDRIFDKFTELKARSKGRKYGAGLGLAFCKLAVETMGGRVWAESEEGQGAKFCVEIPTP